MQTRPKPVLVVADGATSVPLSAKNVIRVADPARIFPAIHELQPTAIVLDYDYLNTDTEKILRRLKSNPFYSKIKISCFKLRPHTRVDDLLKTLGVEQFIYPEAAKPAKAKFSVKMLSRIVETTVAGKLTEATSY